MVLPEENFQRKDSTVQYYAYRHSTLFKGLNCLLCPLTCGCFWCWTTPQDQIASDMKYKGFPTHKRMADMHFARKARKINRRNSLSDVKPVGKLASIFKSRKELSRQTISPLFAKLPYEIRIEIFKHVLFDTGAVFVDTVKIDQDKWNSFHMIRAQACQLDLATLGDLHTVSPSLLLHKSRLDTALLQTCHLAYIEALPILYVQTQFVFQHPRHLVAFSHSIPRTHHAHIRSIRMDFSTISNYQEYRRDYSSFVHHRTFVTPLRRPMQEYFHVIRSMQCLRFMCIAFNITGDMHVSGAELGVMLPEIQEYHERTRGATGTQCRVHLSVYNVTELVCQKTSSGLIKLDRAN